MSATRNFYGKRTRPNSRRKRVARARARWWGLEDRVRMDAQRFHRHSNARRQRYLDAYLPRARLAAKAFSQDRRSEG